MWTNLRALALLCFILPILTVIVSYFFSIKLHLVSYCIPIFEGCTSISRVGRNYPINIFFKPMMFLYSYLLFLYWYNFLKKLKGINLEEKKFFWLSLLSVIFLILYITFLGENKIYTFFRRIGIYIYILFTVVMQFLISKKLYFNYKNINNKKKILNNFNIKFIKLNYFLTYFLILSGMLLLPVLIMKIDTFPQLKNIISWNYFTLIQFFFLFSFLGFKKN